MNALLPTVDQADQLARLRAIQVRRAREACEAARIALEAASRAVDFREGCLRALRGQLDALALATVTRHAVALGRWSGLAAAQRAGLLDRIERESFVLADETNALARARDDLLAARVALGRALSREDAVAGLAAQARGERDRARERLAERETDDASRTAGPDPAGRR